MQETKGIKVVAVFVVIEGTIAVLAGVLSLSKFSLGPPYLFASLFWIALGVFDFFVAGSLHKLRKWAYIVAFIQFLLAVISNIVILVRGGYLILIPLLIGVTLLYLLYRDRRLFS